MPSRASGAIPTGVARTGTSQASASSTASPNPSRSEGTSTALAALTHNGTWLGSTFSSIEQRRVTGDGARAIVALLGAPGVGGEQQVGAARIEPERGASRGPRDRPEAFGVHAAREHGDLTAPRPPGNLPRQWLGHGPDQVQPAQSRRA